MLLECRFLFAALCLVLSLSFSGSGHRRQLPSTDAKWRREAPSQAGRQFAPSGDRSRLTTPLRRLSRTNSKPRPLSPKQLRAREKYTPPSRPYVFREHKFKERLSLANITVGQQLTGKIIAIKQQGLFVDVGTVKDGLVHVKDASEAYFLEKTQLDRIFTPGQHVDVWVKFVDPLARKLGLQMFPPSARSKIEGFEIVSLDIASEVSGKAVKYSDYGVWLDIGAGDDLAYLPKRKIKVHPRMRNWQPWEIVPLGTEVNCLVHEKDEKKRRLSLTTYPISEWDDNLPQQLKEREIDPNIEKFGVVKATQIRLRREYANVTFEDVVGESDEEQDPDAGLQRVKDRGGVRGGNVVMDDFAEQPEDDWDESDDSSGRSVAMSAALGKPVEGKPFTRAEKSRGIPWMTPEFDMPTDEVWERLVGKHTYISLTKMMRWEKIQFYVQRGMLDISTVDKVMQDVGAVRGKIFQHEFETFLTLLQDVLGLKSRDSYEAQQWEDSLPYRQLPNNPQWEEVVWQYLTKDKRMSARLSFTDVLQWPAISSLIAQTVLTMVSVERMYRKTAAKEDGLVGRLEFTRLVEQLQRHVKRVYFDVYKEGYQVTDQDDPEYEEFNAFGIRYDNVSSLETDSKDVVDSAPLFPERGEEEVDSPSEEFEEADQNENFPEEGEDVVEEQEEEVEEKELLNGDEDSEDGEEGEQSEEERQLFEPFHQLANGKTFVSLKNLKKWDLIMSMIEKNIIDEDQLKEMLDQLTPNRKLLLGHWPTFCYELAVLNEKYEQSIQEEEKRLAPSSVDSEGNHDVNVDSDFRLLAGDRTTVCYNELMQYPLIESLLSQNRIDESTLRRLVVKLARKTRAVRKNEVQREAIRTMKIDVNLFNSILEAVVNSTSKDDS